MPVIVKHYRIPAEGYFPDKDKKKYKKKGSPDWKLLLEYIPGVTDWTPHPTGGATMVTIQEGGESYTGVTFCSMSETFSYKAGETRARLRANMQRLLSTSARSCRTLLDWSVVNRTKLILT